MKKLITCNLMMILLAWCLYLNRYYVSAFLINALASVLIIYIMYDKINYWRFLTVFFLGLIIGNFAINSSTINLFFYGLDFFVGMLMFNVACLSEVLIATKNKQIFPFLIICLIAFTSFLLILFLIPKDDYSLFTLINLFILISLIFVPYTSVMLINVMIKGIISVNHKNDKLIINKVSS